MEYLILIFEFFYTREKRNYFSLLVIPTIVALITQVSHFLNCIMDAGFKPLLYLHLILAFQIAVRA